MPKSKLPATEYPALQKFVMKGVTTKASVREAVEELGQLIESLESIRDLMDEAVCTWDEDEDAEARAEAKAELEGYVTDLDQPLSNAGYCAGQKPYEPEDA